MGNFTLAVQSGMGNEQLINPPNFFNSDVNSIKEIKLKA